MPFKIENLNQTIGQISAAVERRMGQLVNHDDFTIRNGEISEDLAERIEDMAILSVAKDLNVSMEVVMTCHQHVKDQPKKIKESIYDYF